MTEPMFPVVTHDADRERIRARARLARDVLADLEEAAISAASRHGHQVDALKTELAEAQRQLATPSLPFPAVDMTVGLDDIRALLAETGQDSPAIGALLVVDGDEVQVVDSLHAILADVAMLTDAVRNGRVIAAEAQAARDRAVQASADNAAAEAGYAAELAQDLQTAVDALVAAIAPISRGNAKLARLSNPIGAMRIVTEVVEDVARQILDGVSGENVRALAIARSDADRIEDEIHAIEAVCEAGGMPPTIEREDIPAWLAEHLTTRIERKEKAKKAKKAKAPDFEADDDQGQLSILDEAANV